MIDFSDKALWYLGVNSYDWSNLARPETKYAYYLILNDQGIYPSGCKDRYLAFSVQTKEANSLSQTILCAERVCNATSWRFAIRWGR